jgi:hypothetical protein
LADNGEKPSRAKVEEAKDDLLEKLRGLDPDDFQSKTNVKRAFEEWKRRLGKAEHGVGMGRLTGADQAEVATAVEAAARRFDEHRAATGTGDVTGDDVRYWGYNHLGLKKVRTPPERREDLAARAATAEQRQRVADFEKGIRHQADAGARELAHRNGAPTSESSPDEPGLDEQLESRKRSKIREFKSERWGFMSDTAARKLVEAGIDPFDPPRVLDAEKYGLKRPTINRLTAQGVRVVNAPGTRADAAGYGRRELLTGRLAGVDSVEGEARIEGQRGLLRRRKVWTEDANGNVRKVTLDPRYTGGGLLAGLKNSTVGAFRRSLDAKKRQREEARLRDPYYRIRRIEQLELRQRLVELEGEMSEASGLRRWWLRQRLNVVKWSMVHKGWLAFVVAASVLFVPWIGVLEYTGWGLGSLALTALKYASLSLVTVYNVLAASLVGVLNLVATTVVGTLEAAAREWLEKLDLDPLVCTGKGAAQECNNRLFSYTVARVDTTFPGFPTMPQPGRFDGRTLFEFVLQLLGIRWDFFNHVWRLVRGE